MLRMPVSQVTGKSLAIRFKVKLESPGGKKKIETVLPPDSFVKELDWRLTLPTI